MVSFAYQVHQRVAHIALCVAPLGSSVHDCLEGGRIPDPLVRPAFCHGIVVSHLLVLRAAGVALTTSCVNILILTIMHGQQLAWVCLASCGTDVSYSSRAACIEALNHYLSP